MVNKLRTKDFPIIICEKKLTAEVDSIIDIPNKLERHKLLPPNTTKEEAIQCLIEHIDCQV